MVVTLGLIADMIGVLEEGGIRYCHWKSSSSLPVALAGKTDLDLLVDRADSARFADAVAGLDYKRFISHPSRQLPGVEDWLGLDRSSRRLVHLHVYYELVLGEELVKNHRLPVERVLLEHTTLRHGMPVPTPELELAILAVRALLKYREDAFLRDLVPIGHRGGLPAGISDEVSELLERTTPEAVGEAIERLMPMLPATVIVAFLNAAVHRPVEAWRLRALRRDLERALRPYARRGELAVAPRRAAAALSRSRFTLAGRRIGERIRGRPSGRRKRPEAGGRAVAIIGIDGAGKSTVIDALVETFGWRINVATLYLGSARPGLSTAASQAAARLALAGSRWLSRRLDALHPIAGPARLATDLALGFRAVGEANDRARRVRLGRRLAAEGWLVLFDRYPMPDLHVGERRMDAIRLPSAQTQSGWLRRRLALRERAIYHGIPGAELLIVLRLDVETARSRKPSGTIALGAKAQGLAALGDGDESMVVIDASQPLEDVLRRVTAAVWDRL